MSPQTQHVNPGNVTSNTTCHPWVMSPPTPAWLIDMACLGIYNVYFIIFLIHMFIYHLKHHLSTRRGGGQNQGSDWYSDAERVSSHHRYSRPMIALRIIYIHVHTFINRAWSWGSLGEVWNSVDSPSEHDFAWPSLISAEWDVLRCGYQTVRPCGGC